MKTKQDILETLMVLFSMIVCLSVLYIKTKEVTAIRDQLEIAHRDTSLLLHKVKLLKERGCR